MGRNFRPPLLDFEANYNSSRRLNYLIDANLSDTEYNELVDIMGEITDVSTRYKQKIKVASQNPGQVKELAQHVVGFNPSRNEVYLKEHYIIYFFDQEANKNEGMQKLLAVRDGGHINSYDVENVKNGTNGNGELVKMNRSLEFSNVVKFDVETGDQVVMPTQDVEEVIEETSKEVKKETNKKNLRIGLLVLAALIVTFIILKKKKII